MNKNKPFESGAPEQENDRPATREEIFKARRLDTNEDAISMGDAEEDWLKRIESPGFESWMKRLGFKAKIERDEKGVYKKIEVFNKSGEPLFFWTNKEFDATSRHPESGKRSVN